MRKSKESANQNNSRKGRLLRYWCCESIRQRKNISFQIESPLDSVYQGVGESSLLIEIEGLKLVLSHANDKENLLNSLLEQKDNEVNAIRELLQIVNFK